jgi:hypothetical protein
MILWMKNIVIEKMWDQQLSNNGNLTRLLLSGDILSQFFFILSSCDLVSINFLNRIQFFLWSKNAKKKKICRFFGIQKYNPDVSNFDSRIYLRAIIDNRFISLKEFCGFCFVFVLILIWCLRARLNLKESEKTTC